jgi:hypothetical protein
VISETMTLVERAMEAARHARSLAGHDTWRGPRAEQVFDDLLTIERVLHGQLSSISTLMFRGDE